MAAARWALLLMPDDKCPMANARWPLTLLFDGRFSMAALLFNGLSRWPLLDSRCSVIPLLDDLSF